MLIPFGVSSTPLINEVIFPSGLLSHTKMKSKMKPLRYLFLNWQGKNRMFEVQVQGRFKKPPEGDLYISLEITDRMKLGLLTKVKVLIG